MKASNTLVTALASLLLWSSAHAQVAQVGQPAPELGNVTIVNHDNPSLTLASLRGKVVILEFWATWCGPCLSTAQYLDELQQTLGDQLVVVSLSNESESRIRRFLENRPSEALVGVYPAGLENRYPHRAIPHGILIDRQGQVVAIDHPMRFSAERIREVYKASAPPRPTPVVRKAPIKLTWRQRWQQWWRRISPRT